MKTNLYRIMYDAQPFWVEAHDLTQAVYLWREHVKVLWGGEYEGDEQPESIELVHQGNKGPAVIRAS